MRLWFPVGLAVSLVAICVWWTTRDPESRVERRPAPKLAFETTIDELVAGREPPADATADEDGPERPSEIDFDVAETPATRRWLKGRHRHGWVRDRPVEPSTPRKLARIRRFELALRALKGLKGDLADNLTKALEAAENPVARQNVIFLAVLTLPYPEAYQWLTDAAAKGDDEDREDVTCALAFSGDPDARAAFRRLATAPADARVREIRDHVRAVGDVAERGTVEARRIVRSYRCIDVLDRDPYFDITYVYVPWQPHPEPSDDLSRELLGNWVRRYPGHPGGDDMAWRLGRIHTRKGDHLMAARWYSRAATMPDKDVTTGSIMRLIATAELMLSPAQLDLLAHEEGLDTPNRRLVRYIWIRKVAAREGFVPALRLAAAFAQDDPESPFGRAWRNRIAVAPAKGLDSGVAPLPRDDPLRRRGAWPRAPEKPSPRLGGYYDDLEPGYEEAEARLEPKPDFYVLDERILAGQLRRWETLAELDRRASRARGAERGDLLYKQAAIFYHDSRVLFPAYGRQTFGFGLGIIRRDMPGRLWERAYARFESESYAMRRAVELFRRVGREAPGYPAMDKVLFSLGMAHKKLMDYKPLRPHSDARLAELRRAVIESFEGCARFFPKSDLAPSAKLAAAWWRRQEQ